MRPELDYQSYSAPTAGTYMGLFPFGFEWKNAGISMLRTLQSTYFPAIIWVTLANTAFLVVNSASQQISSFALLAQG
jgi:hypothetical protein